MLKYFKAFKKELEMSRLFKSLKKSLEEALAYAEGKINLKSETINIPEPPAKYSAEDIKKIREQKQSLQKF